MSNYEKRTKLWRSIHLNLGETVLSLLWTKQLTISSSTSATAFLCSDLTEVTAVDRRPTDRQADTQDRTKPTTTREENSRLINIHHINNNIMNQRVNRHSSPHNPIGNCSLPCRRNRRDNFQVTLTT